MPGQIEFFLLGLATVIDTVELNRFVSRDDFLA
jgi:hypothetical protein